MCKIKLDKLKLFLLKLQLIDCVVDIHLIGCFCICEKVLHNINNFFVVVALLGFDSLMQIFIFFLYKLNSELIF